MQPPDGDSLNRSSPDLDADGSTESKSRYLFTVDGEHPEQVLPLVCALLADADAALLIGYPVDVPVQTSLEALEPRLDGERVAAKAVLEAKQRCEPTPPINQAVTVGHGRDTILQTMIERYDVSTLITQARPRSGIRSLLGFEALDEASLPDTCDTVIVNRIEQLETIDSVLVPIAGGPHSEMAIETGLALARQSDASLELLHVYTADDEEERVQGEALLERGTEVLGGYEPAAQTLLEADAIPDAISEYAEPFDVTVFGAPEEGLLQRFMLETVPEEVSERATGTVCIVHRGGAETSWLENSV